MCRAPSGALHGPVCLLLYALKDLLYLLDWFAGAYCAPFPWLAPIITVALHEALRLGEVLGLHWEDVDFGANRLHVRRSLGRDGTLGPPKGGKAATIELTPGAREELLEL